MGEFVLYKLMQRRYYNENVLYKWYDKVKDAVLIYVCLFWIIIT